MADVAFPNIVDAPGSYSYASADLGLDTATTNDVEEGADVSTVLLTGREILIVFNSTGAPITLSVTSVIDSRTGRAASTAQEDKSIPAGETHVLGNFLREGWAGADSLLRLQASAVDLRAAVVRTAHID